MSAKANPQRGSVQGVVFQGLPEPVPAEAPALPPLPRPLDPGRHKLEFPSGDGLPMSDNNFQAVTMHYSGTALALHFEGRGYVATDVLVYYDPNEPKTCVAPDVLVVLGLEGYLRNSYKVWEEGGRVPDFVLEVVSNSTQERDAGRKRRTYAKLGVTEYFRYAPTNRRMAGMNGHRLVGETLSDGQWKPLPRLGEERIPSAVLELELRVRQEYAQGSFRELRFHDPATGKDLPTHREDKRAREAERQRRLAEQRAREQAERAREEAERACEAERQRRLAVERELEELRASLEEQSHL
ncbi:MAG: Uma2 family endonuclease [Bryobacterales bacterium]|nr:Uma2 family endonuclease [Bryobacterales bacterium]